MDDYSIEKINFGLLSPEEIKALSVCKIENKNSSGFGSIYDERMGHVDRNKECPTCKLKKQCWGHFGYIELEEPLLHPMFYKHLVNILKCFCKNQNCHKLLKSKESMELSGYSKLSLEKKIEKLKDIEICYLCSFPQPKIMFNQKDMIISQQYKTKKKTNIIPFDVCEIRKFLNSINDEDFITLGFNIKMMHPKNLVISVLPVIPTCSRPYVVNDGKKCDDDITYQYREICKINLLIENLNKDLTEENKTKKQKLLQALKFRIQTLFSNSKGKAKHPTDNRPLLCIKGRISGKGGRIRKNIMGKRVFFSARTVIGPETDVKMDEIAIPEEVARTHTKHEVVSKYNIKYLTKLVNEGKANFINIKKGDKTIIINLKYGLYKQGTVIRYGDIIQRGEGGGEGEEGDCVSGAKGDCVSGAKGDVLYSSLEEFVKHGNGKGKFRVITGDEKLKKGDILIRDGAVMEVKPTIKNNIMLNIGDVVERHLENGEFLITNRQPS
jgi:DNA-directed RNA polymerase beta' subunit